MLTVENLQVALSGRAVLTEISLRFEPGMLTVVVGPNGAGKSTLMRVLTGELAARRGSVVLEGRPLADWPGPALARKRAVLPQASSLAFPFTVYEVVALGQRASGAGTDPLVMLEQVGLSGYEGRFYQQLSGGEQQRVQLARVLCQIGSPVAEDGPRWLFLDEPTSNLDIRHQFAILRLARDHARAGGGIVAVLHDLNMASLFADRLVVVSNGRLAGDGAPAEVLVDDLLREVFDVELRVNVVPSDAPPFVLPHSAMP